MEYLADANGRRAPQSDETKTEPESQNNYVHDLRGDDGDGKEEGKLTLEEQIATLQAKLSAKEKHMNKPAQALVDSIGDVLVPRITEDMDLTALKAEAWERGCAASDGVSKEQLLAQLFVGSMCISRFKQMAYTELAELKGSEMDQKRSAADIFFQHGLEFHHFFEVINNFVVVSKEVKQHCTRLLENECKMFAPALFESIARSTGGSRGNKLTFGRMVRHEMPLPPPGIATGKRWPSVQVSDLRNIVVLIHILDRGAVATHQAIPLCYDADSRELFANAACKHFEYVISLPSSTEGEILDTPVEEDALKRASANPLTSLSVRVVFRHRESGRMAVALIGTLPATVWEPEGDLTGSYALTFANTIISESFQGQARLNLRLYSDVVKDDETCVKFSTCPFPHSPANDADIPGLPSYAETARSTDAAQISFHILSNSFEDNADESNSDSDEDEFEPRPMCTLGALRTCLGMNKFLFSPEMHQQHLLDRKGIVHMVEIELLLYLSNSLNKMHFFRIQICIFREVLCSHTQDPSLMSPPLHSL